VATAVVLLPASASGEEPSLRPAVIAALSRLGITGIAVVRDDRTLGLVIEGWAFDPHQSAEAVITALGAPDRAQTLYPLLELAVSSAVPPTAGGTPRTGGLRSSKGPDFYGRST
jgi:hypothetical protein